MAKQVFIALSILSTLPYSFLTGMTTDSHQKALQASSQEQPDEKRKLLADIRHNPNSQDIALANRAAFAGSLKTLEQLFDDNPDTVFQDPAECFSPTSYTALFSQPSPQLLGTPLLFAVLSARQPEQKINFLKTRGQLFDNTNPDPTINPFWAALERHEHENSSMTRSIIITLLRNYPETLNAHDLNGETILVRLRRTHDTRLEQELLPFLRKSASFSALAKKYLWNAIDMYDHNPSSKNRAVISTFLRNYPESILSRKEDETILIHAARNVDPALIADILWETNYNAQLIDAPIESSLKTPAERMQITPDAERIAATPLRAQTALEIVKITSYTPPSHLFTRLFNSEDIFESRKNACISLLEDAHTKIQSRAQNFINSRKNEAPVKGLYPKIKKEQ